MKGKKLTNEEFSKRINDLYNDKYDLSKVDVEHRDEKGRVNIICPIHGDFFKTPNNILLGHGCPRCAFEKMGKEKTQTTEWFIKESNKIHNNEYDYSKTEYKGNRYSVDIICHIHGLFKQQAANHLKGMGCPKCAYERISKLKSMTTSNFIQRSKEIFGDDKYSYEKTNLENRRDDGKVCIICPIHGDFWQLPSSHLQGNGCAECGRKRSIVRKSYNIKKSKKYNTSEIIDRFKKIHHNKYSYNKTEYKGSKKKVCITCPIHGDFWQLPTSHLQGSGCPKCANNQKIDTEEFINRSIKKHGNLYDYSKSKYKNNRTKIEIICHKKDSNGIEHGSFFTTPHSHMQGSGCPKCKQNYRLENEVRLLLLNNNIEFEEKKTFEGLKHKIALRPDFYLPKYNIIIECQGEQHFKPINFGGKDNKTLMEQYMLNQKRDEIKKIYCKKNNITLLEYTHSKIKNDTLIKTEKELLKKILANDNDRNKKT